MSPAEELAVILEFAASIRTQEGALVSEGLVGRTRQATCMKLADAGAGAEVGVGVGGVGELPPPSTERRALLTAAHDGEKRSAAGARCLI